MRLVIIGGSSQSTPHFFLSREIYERAHSLEVTLAARSESRLAAVARAAALLCPAASISTKSIAADLSHEFACADAIVVQARYGGLEARVHDETFPPVFGIPGDEGLGPGGLANAWRTWQHVDGLLGRIAAANASARIVFLTAPLGILTRCALAKYPSLQWFALCELPYSTLRDVCRGRNLDPRLVTYDYSGVNHLGWFDSVRSGDEELLDAPLPLKYQRLENDRERVVAEQRRGPSRGERLRQASERALGAFGDGDAAAMRAALAQRPAPWYDDAVAPFLAALCGKPSSLPFFLTTTNEGYVGELGDEEVVEIPHYFNGSLRRLARSRPVPATLLRRLERMVRYERLAAAAVLGRDRLGVACALRAHPWVDAQHVDGLVRQIVVDDGSDALANRKMR